MTEQKFLEDFIFNGLKNLNEGVDASTIYHFSEEDFETVLERIEEYDIEIFGIECWTKNKIRTVKYEEDYSAVKHWHRIAYKELRRQRIPCTFSATYDIPPGILKKLGSQN